MCELKHHILLLWPIGQEGRGVLILLVVLALEQLQAQGFCVVLDAPVQICDPQHDLRVTKIRWAAALVIQLHACTQTPAVLEGSCSTCNQSLA